MIRRAATAVAEANQLVRAPIILTHLVCADETPLRAGPGPKARKRYLLVACTNLLTYHSLGDRSAKTFAAFVFPDMDGAVLVHDRYQNYNAFPGLSHQLCCTHLIRDLEDAAQAYPGAHWPIQIRQTQQKISGRLRSEQATRHRYAIRGYLSTAAKHGINAMAALRDAITGSPRMPLIPGPP